LPIASPQFANTFSFNQVDCRHKQVSIAAMREAYAAGFAILAKVASKQPANRVLLIYRILLGTLLEFAKTTKKKKP